MPGFPIGPSPIAEVYPALWSGGFAKEGSTGDQHDAFSIAAWLPAPTADGSLAAFLNPDLSPSENARWHRWRVDSWRYEIAPSADQSAEVSHASPRTASVAENDRTTYQESLPGVRLRGGTWGGIDAHWKACHKVASWGSAWRKYPRPTISGGDRRTERRCVMRSESKSASFRQPIALCGILAPLK